ERARDGRELVLEAAPALAQRRDAGEHRRDVAGVVRDAALVRYERGTGLQAVGGAVGARRIADRVLEDALVATVRRAPRDRPGARAKIAADDGDVDVGETAHRALRGGHERREVVEHGLLQSARL